MNILISACLLGMKCRYDGSDNYVSQVMELKEKYHLIPICPEIFGGMSTPRMPAEIRNNMVITSNGKDVTAAFQKGAEEALKLARFFECSCAVLKERSPSCGSGCIYDGSFAGALIKGSGMTARLLSENGIEIVGESQIQKLL